MITIEKSIAGLSRPTMAISKACACDKCGTTCYPDGFKDQGLYTYDGEELCFDCLWDALQADQVFTKTE